MTNLYFIRHASANASGENYDMLSARGKLQAQALADYFAKWQIFPDTILTGTLRRQQETAEPLEKILDVQNHPYKLQRLEALNEILQVTWRSIAEYIAQSDPRFAKVVEEWQRTKIDDSKRSHVLFYQITETVLKNWQRDNIPQGIATTDTCKNFTARVFGFLQSLETLITNEKHVVIISSGTPLSFLFAKILDWPHEKNLFWLKKIWNTSFSQVKKENGQLVPISINSLPHIPKKELQSLV
ncbi:MAG: histidine phosphatase family protein [Spirochaetota bacterium]